jgi:hypothetical protein
MSDESMDRAISEVRALREHNEEAERIEGITIKQIRERHKKEIEDFQRDCRHSVISDWMPFMWAPGHYGLDVKICNRCNKTMETRP